MKRQLVWAALVVLMMAFSGCKGQGTATAQDTPKGDTAVPTEQEDAQPAIKTFAVQPVDGWTLFESASNDAFKSYNLLEPYVGSANFWIRYVGSGVYGGKAEDVKASLKSLGFTDYELVGVDKLDYQMPVVRCVAHTAIQGMKFTLGHYFIDAPGDDDIYFQLSAAPENFAKAQKPWEEALKTLTVE